MSRRFFSTWFAYAAVCAVLVGGTSRVLATCGDDYVMRVPVNGSAPSHHPMPAPTRLLAPIGVPEQNPFQVHLEKPATAEEIFRGETPTPCNRCPFETDPFGAPCTGPSCSGNPVPATQSTTVAERLPRQWAAWFVFLSTPPSAGGILDLFDDPADSEIRPGSIFHPPRS